MGGIFQISKTLFSPKPGTPRGMSKGGCKRSLPLRCWAGKLSQRRRGKRRKKRLTWRTRRRRRRGASVWELRLAAQQFLRRGALKLVVQFQLQILSLCQLWPPLIFLHPPMSGFLCSPSQLSTPHHHVVWCLDNSGFVAPVGQFLHRWIVICVLWPDDIFSQHCALDLPYWGYSWVNENWAFSRRESCNSRLI